MEYYICQCPKCMQQRDKEIKEDYTVRAGDILLKRLMDWLMRDCKECVVIPEDLFRVINFHLYHRFK